METLLASHMGDVGDLISAMSSFQAMTQTRRDAPARPIELKLYPAPGQVREVFTPTKVDRLADLFHLQPYVHSVQFAEEPAGLVLDGWRKKRHRHQLNLADMFASWLRDQSGFGQVANPDRNKPWLVIDERWTIAPVVIHRSPRYRHRSRMPWAVILRAYAGQVVMVGTEQEHADFVQEWGDVPYYPTETYLDLCRVLAGATLFVGNQSSPYWCALGLGVPTWLEQENARQSNCHWQRATSFYDHAQLPPNLCDLEQPRTRDEVYRQLSAFNDAMSWVNNPTDEDVAELRRVYGITF